MHTHGAFGDFELNAGVCIRKQAQFISSGVQTLRSEFATAVGEDADGLRVRPVQRNDFASLQ
jgi:hypothetical protein